MEALFDQAAGAQTGPIAVNAIGSVPADDEVEVVEVLVKAGDVVKVGDLVAVVEATKATVEVQTTVSGKVVGIAVVPKQKVPVKAKPRQQDKCRKHCTKGTS